MKLDDLLGDAYMAIQREANKPKAIGLIRTALEADPDLKVAAGARVRELSELFRVRGRRACHVSSVTFDLLVAALAT